LNDVFASSTSYPNGVRFVFAKAPFRVHPADVIRSSDAGPRRAVSNAWTWCKELTERPGSYCYDNGGLLLGLEHSLDSLADIIRAEGPFDGIIGFSFGAGVALLVASLLEPGRKGAFDQLDGPGSVGFPKSFIPTKGNAVEKSSSLQSPLKFAIVFSGLAAEHKRYRAFYYPEIKTPTLHFIAKWDTVVEKRQSLALVDACEKVEAVIYHPGAHYVPRQRIFVQKAAAFVKRYCF
jgi:fermentation-respiration switch protein FrsA (DUF1100 family)